MFDIIQQWGYQAQDLLLQETFYYWFNLLVLFCSGFLCLPSVLCWMLLGFLPFLVGFMHVVGVHTGFMTHCVSVVSGVSPLSFLILFESSLFNLLVCINICQILFSFYLFIFLFIFICGIRVWTQDLMLARQALYHLHHSTNTFLSFKNKFLLIFKLSFWSLFYLCFDLLIYFLLLILGLLYISFSMSLRYNT
jgi:hypothetical protein